jgi:hypothetical protein
VVAGPQVDDHHNRVYRATGGIRTGRRTETSNNLEEKKSSRSRLILFFVKI